jgi:HEAT repeat protein
VEESWSWATGNNTIGAYERFLDEYPDAPYAAEARTRLERLRWDEAVKRDDITAFEEYLDWHPHGAFAEGARAKVEQKKSALKLVTVRTAAIVNQGSGGDAARELEIVVWKTPDAALAKRREMSAELERIVAESLTTLGLNVVRTADGSADATLTIGRIELALPGEWAHFVYGSGGERHLIDYRYSCEMGLSTRAAGAVFHRPIAGERLRGEFTIGGPLPDASTLQAEHATRRDTLLSDAAERIPSSVVHHLGKERFAAATADIVRQLESTNVVMRRGAAYTLCNFQSDAAVDALLTVGLQDADLRVRTNSCLALGALGNARAVPALLDKLQNGAEKESRYAAVALSQRKLAANDALLTALDNPRRYVAANAAWALGEIKEQRAVDPLLKMLQANDPGVRGNAAIALGKLKAPTATTALAALLVRPGEGAEIRAACATALGRIGDRQAVPMLLTALGDQDVRLDARWALTQIAGHDFGYDVAKWQAWWSVNENSK